MSRREGVWERKRIQRKERVIRENGEGVSRGNGREKEKEKDEEKEEGEGKRKGKKRKEQGRKREGKEKERVVGAWALLRNRRGTARR